MKLLMADPKLFTADMLVLVALLTAEAVSLIAASDGTIEDVTIQFEMVDSCDGMFADSVKNAQLLPARE